MKSRQKIRKIIQFLSFLLFPVTLNYFSPYLILAGGFMGFVTASALTFGALFFFSLFGGRLFCSWLCPAGAAMDLLEERIHPRRAPLNRVRYVKFVIWAPWLGAIAAGYLSAESLSLNPWFFFESRVSVDEPARYVIYYGVLFLLLVGTPLFGRRGSCHLFCWMSPFMILGKTLSRLAKLPRLRLRARGAACLSCGACTKNCPMGLNVQGMVASDRMEHRDCILCGECADACPSGAILF